MRRVQSLAPVAITVPIRLVTDRRYKLVNADTGKDMRDALDFEIAEIRASRHGVVPLELCGGTYAVPDTVSDRRLEISRRRRVVAAGKHAIRRRIGRLDRCQRGPDRPKRR